MSLMNTSHTYLDVYYKAALMRQKNAETCMSAYCMKKYIYLLINLLYYRPKADIKIGMARAVVEEFPFLKDDEGQGFVSSKI